MEKKNSRMSNRIKLYLLSMIAVFFMGITGFIAEGAVKYFNEADRKKQEEQLKPYEYKLGLTNIEAKGKDQYLVELQKEVGKLNAIIDDKGKEIDRANVQHREEVRKMQEEISRSQQSLRRKYAYALNYPGSDMTVNDLRMIEKICKKDGLNMHLYLAMIELESEYRSRLKSSRSSATGWGQVIRGTGKEIYEDKLKLGTYHHSMATNKKINVEISAYELATHIKKFGVEKGLIRYNGSELGYRYVSLVAKKLKKNTGLGLSQVAPMKGTKTTKGR